MTTFTVVIERFAFIGIMVILGSSFWFQSKSFVVHSFSCTIPIPMTTKKASSSSTFLSFHPQNQVIGLESSKTEAKSSRLYASNPTTTSSTSSSTSTESDAPTTNKEKESNVEDDKNTDNGNDDHQSKKEEDHAPQYDKCYGILQEAEIVGDGSVLLHIVRDINNNSNDSTTTTTTTSTSTSTPSSMGYAPGHVLALEIQPNFDDDDDDDNDDDEQLVIDEKTRKDMERNDGWMRAPYTVTRSRMKTIKPTDEMKNKEQVQQQQHYQQELIDVLIKVVGTKSKVLATAKPGTPIRYGGKFHVPIVDGILAAAEGSKDKNNDVEQEQEQESIHFHPLKRIVMLSTGVGVGPCVGAIEQWLSTTSSSSISTGTIAIDLYASYRYESETLFGDYLNVWSTAYENFRFKPLVTSEVGRTSSSIENVRLIIRDNKDMDDEYDDDDGCCSVTETHYHLIGNGAMVHEWKTGLYQAGVPKARVTVESYFNHNGGGKKKKNNDNNDNNSDDDENEKEATATVINNIATVVLEGKKRQ